jgi:hypothetical protein
MLDRGLKYLARETDTGLQAEKFCHESSAWPHEDKSTIALGPI